MKQEKLAMHPQDIGRSPFRDYVDARTRHISKVCDSYFSGFHEIAHVKENSAGTNVLLALKILSYATVVIPLTFALLKTSASLVNRVLNKNKPTPEDGSAGDIASKSGIIQDDSPLYIHIATIINKYTESEDKAIADLKAHPNDLQKKSTFLRNTIETLDLPLIYSSDLLEIANLMLQIKSRSAAELLADRIQEFSITDETFRIKIAEFIAEKAPRALADKFANFKIENEAAKIKIAAALARQVPTTLAKTFDIYKIENEDARAKIAQIVAEHAPDDLINKFELFNITKELNLFEIAKVLASKSPASFSFAYPKFKLDDISQRFELFKILAKENPVLAARMAETFNLDGDAKARDFVSNLELRIFHNLAFHPIETLHVHLIKRAWPNFLIGLEDSLCVSLLSRLAERDPYLLQNMIESGKYDPKLLAFVSGVKHLSHDMAHQLLEYNYKMNQALPMIPEVVALLERYPDGPRHIQLVLMLQTHSDVSEIEEAMKIEGPYDKESFFMHDLDVQRKLLCRAQVLRDRQALPIANKILKEASQENPVDDKLLEMAIKFFIKTSIAGSRKTDLRLQDLFLNESISNKNKALAIHALGAIEMHPANSQTKKFLIHQLSNSSKDIQRSALEALSVYKFGEEEAVPLVKTLERLAEDPNLKKPVAYLATLLPTEKALALAYRIVNDGTWERPNPTDLTARQGNYTLFTYRPTFHDSQSSMNSIIRQRLVELHRRSLRNGAINILQDYKRNKDKYRDLNQFEKNIRSFDNNIRYFPTPLFLPEGTICFRGINARKGDVLGNAAFKDFFVQGAGASDLTLFEKYDTGTWSKIGQMFSSTSLEYVTKGYFDENGLLMAITGESLNESLLRRSVRLEKETAIHYASYSKLLHHQVSKIFLASHQKSRVEELTKAPYKAIGDTPKASTLDRIARRNLVRTNTSAPTPLKERITYFDPKEDLQLQMQRIIDSEGLKEATIEEIIDENLLRRIMESRLLKDRVQTPQLKKAVANVPEIEPLKVI